MNQQKFDLEKSVWTELDFEQMCWHECVIYAAAFLTETYELLLDIDYIFKWIDPDPSALNYKVWMSPATLVFNNVVDLRLDVGYYDLRIDGIERNAINPVKRLPQSRSDQFTWTILTHDGEIEFESSGFDQFIRSAPVLCEAAMLDLRTRGGFSFERRPIEIR